MVVCFISELLISARLALKRLPDPIMTDDDEWGITLINVDSCYVIYIFSLLNDPVRYPGLFDAFSH